MSEPEPEPDTTTALIINPALGPDSVTEVPRSSLVHHYRAGWRPLAPDEGPKPEAGVGTPEAVSRADVAKQHSSRRGAKAAKQESED